MSGPFTKAAHAIFEVIAGRKESKILEYLRANPGWHYGLDCVKAGLATRGTIYVHLGRLEERGLVERMEGAKTNPGLPRPLYRARESG